MRLSAAAAAVLLALLMSACGGTDGSAEAGGTTSTVTAASSQAPQSQPTKKPEPEPEPDPKPDVSYESSCQDDFPLVFQTGDNSELTMTGFRFVGEVDLYNDGDAPGQVRVEMTWLFFGGGSTSLTRTVEVPAGGHRNVGLIKPSTLDEVSRMAGHQPGDKLCKAQATLIN